jgi:hypothetical protein
VEFLTAEEPKIRRLLLRLRGIISAIVRITNHPCIDALPPVSSPKDTDDSPVNDGGTAFATWKR